MPEQNDPLRLIVSVGAIVALLAVVVLDIRSLSDESLSHQASLATARPADASDRELERCRIITPEQLASAEACQRAWAETRRHFFALDHDPVKSLTTNLPTPPSPSSAKPPGNNDRLGVGRPATPERRSE